MPLCKICIIGQKGQAQMEWSMDYITLLRGCRYFKNDWTDQWYTMHVIKDRDIWENLEFIMMEQIENIVIQFLREYQVQYTVFIKRDKLGSVLQNLSDYSKILRGKKLLDLNFHETVSLEEGATTWVSEIIKKMYNDLRSVYGIGATSASKMIEPSS
ncbi:MAG: hypothetical protein ACFFB3_23725 [Candidatus Hodarchaeota archaeon]